MTFFAGFTAADGFSKKAIEVSREGKVTLGTSLSSAEVLKLVNTPPPWSGNNPPDAASIGDYADRAHASVLILASELVKTRTALFTAIEKLDELSKKVDSSSSPPSHSTEAPAAEPKKGKKMPKKTQVERIFEALRNPEITNLEIGEGEILQGVHVTFVFAKGKKGEKPIALLLDLPALDALSYMAEAAEVVEDMEGPEDEDDDDDGGDEDEDEDEEDRAPRRRGKTFEP